MAKNLRRKASRVKLTRDDVLKYKIDWNEWHDIVHNSMAAFDFDAVAFVADRIGFVNGGYGESDKSLVRGAELALDVEHVCSVLIALYELGYEMDADNPEFIIYDNYCKAFKSVMSTEGIYHAVIKFRNNNNPDDRSVPVFINEPCIEVKLALDDQNKPWFEINFNVVMQSF